MQPGRVFSSLLALACLISPWISQAADYQSGYNEMFDAKGRLRPAYRAFEAHHNRRVLSPSSRAVQELAIKNPLQDKVKVLPIALVLDSNDNTRTTNGAQQRLRALALFFEDVVLGEGKIFSIVSREEIKRLFRDEEWNLDEVRRLWKGKSLQYLSLQYGPDLTRTILNEFTVLEDNIGLLGGIVDYTSIRNAFVEHHGLGSEMRDDPGFLHEALKVFFAQAHGDPAKGEIIAFMSDIEREKKLKPRDRPHEDLESLRTALVLESLGVEIWDPVELSAEQQQKLHSGKVKGIVNFSHPYDWSEIRKMWNELFLERGIYFYQSPGITALSNKGFLPYLPRFIEFYLGEKPILETPETKILEMDPNSTFEMKQNKVYKLASGLQGYDVFIPHRLSPETLEEARLRLSQHYDKEQLTGATVKLWIEQEYVEPSFLPGGRKSWLSYIVDFRPITIYNGGVMRTMPTPWIRASSNLGDGKNNVSRGAFEAVSFVEECNKLLRPNL